MSPPSGIAFTGRRLPCVEVSHTPQRALMYTLTAELPVIIMDMDAHARVRERVLIAFANETQCMHVKRSRVYALHECGRAARASRCHAIGQSDT